MSLTNKEAKKIIDQVMDRASYDEEFRKLALEDPKKAIKEISTDVEIPEGYTVSFIEGDPDADRTFVLPPLKSELSDEDLDQVAGGNWIESSNSIPEPDCFLTSATCRTLAKGDNCEELNTLRRFRDNWLKKQTYGPELIEEYYHIAPGIVEEIRKREDSHSIYNYMWENYIKVCYEFILQKEHERAVDKYKEMVYELMENRLILRNL